MRGEIARIAVAVVLVLLAGHAAFGGEDVKIRLVFGDEHIVVNMRNNPTSADLLSLLPLTLSFRDYADTEKTAYPPRKLVHSQF